jgi:hypothetical protein
MVLNRGANGKFCEVCFSAFYWAFLLSLTVSDLNDLKCLNDKLRRTPQ